MAKCTFDGPNKLILINAGVTEIDVKADIYSEWKAWILLGNSKFLEAIRSVGGDPISDTKVLGSTFFLINGWKIRPPEENCAIIVTGNLYSDDGSSPYTSVLGSWQITIISSVSNLTDSTIQQLPQIEYSSFNGGVTVDTNSVYSGTIFPVGTPQQPVNNLTDAKLIGVTRGFNTFFIKGNITLLGGPTPDDVSDYILIGEGASTNVSRSIITMVPGCITQNTEFNHAMVLGVQNGEGIFYECVIGELSNTHCVFDMCMMIGPVTLYHPDEEPGWLASHVTDLHNCHSGGDWYILDYNNSPINQVYSEFSGKIKIINCTDSRVNIMIRFNAGMLWVDASCTAGAISVEGVGTVVNESIIDVDVVGLISREEVVKALLKEVHIDFLHGESGTVWPTGSDTNPSNNYTHAKAIAIANNLTKFNVHGNYDFSNSDVLSGYKFIGDSYSTVTLSFDDTTCVETNFQNVRMSGSMTSASHIMVYDGDILDLSNISGDIYNCSLSGELTLNNVDTTNLIECYDGLVGPETGSINAGTSIAIGLWGWMGGIELRNCNNEALSIGINAHQLRLILTNTVVNVEYIRIKGVGIVDYSASPLSLSKLDLDGLVNPGLISDITWNEATSSHALSGSFGDFVQNKILTVAKFLGLK